MEKMTAISAHVFAAGSQRAWLRIRRTIASAAKTRARTPRIQRALMRAMVRRHAGRGTMPWFATQLNVEVRIAAK